MVAISFPHELYEGIPATFSHDLIFFAGLINKPQSCLNRDYQLSLLFVRQLRQSTSVDQNHFKCCIARNTSVSNQILEVREDLRWLYRPLICNLGERESYLLDEDEL